MEKLEKGFKKKWLEALRSGKYKENEMTKILNLISIDDNNCYNWTGGTNSDGYGYVWFLK